MNVDRARWFETRWRWWFVAAWLGLVGNGIRLVMEQLQP